LHFKYTYTPLSLCRCEAFPLPSERRRATGASSARNRDFLLSLLLLLSWQREKNGESRANMIHHLRKGTAREREPGTIRDYRPNSVLGSRATKKKEDPLWDSRTFFPAVSRDKKKREEEEEGLRDCPSTLLGAPLSRLSPRSTVEECERASERRRHLASSIIYQRLLCSRARPSRRMIGIFDD